MFSMFSNFYICSIRDCPGSFERYDNGSDDCYDQSDATIFLSI